jgi:hypothetical protein
VERYGTAGQDTDILAYEEGTDFIRVRFTDGTVYLYDASHPGASHVAEMKKLAHAGKGLTTYINRHVRKGYARRER